MRWPWGTMPQHKTMDYRIKVSYKVKHKIWPDASSVHDVADAASIGLPDTILPRSDTKFSRIESMISSVWFR